jgi:succinoglycan biosynthesis transport protein ExoP
VQDEGYSVGEVTRLVNRRRRLIGMTFFVFTALSIVVAYSLESLYSSSGVIVIEQPEVANQFLPGTYQAPDPQQRIARINDEVMTRGNLATIIKTHDLYPEQRGSSGPETVVSDLREHFELEMLLAEDDPRNRYAGDVMGFAISFYHPDAETSRNVTRDIVELFLEGNRKRRADAYLGTAEALSREAVEIRATVSDLEANLADFKTENPGALPEDRSYNRQIVERKARDLTELDREIRSLQERKTLLQSQLAQTDPWVTVIGPDGEAMPASADRMQQLQSEYLRLIGIYSANHPDVMRVRREIESLAGSAANPTFRLALEAAYSSKQLELTDAQLQYGPNHPDVLSLQRSILALEQQIEQLPEGTSDLPTPNNPTYVNLEVQLDSLDIELGALQRDRRELQAETRQLDLDIKVAPEVERRYLELTRDLDIARQQYEDTMARRMAVERAGALEASEIAERYVLTRAPSMPYKPAFPNRPLIIIIGLFLGASLGMAAGILAEAFDDSVRSTRDMRTIIGAPPLAAIPLIQTTAEARTVVLSRRRLALAVGAATIAVAIYVQLQRSGVI